LVRLGFLPNASTLLVRHRSHCDACGLPTAQAADTTLTLACAGTSTLAVPDAKPEPYRMSIIFNFTTRVVLGFNSPAFPEWNYPIKITGADDVAVAFRGSRQVLHAEASTSGTIDRITGDLEFTEMSVDPKTSRVTSQTNYALKCRPAQRMF
jgi:hypothetical protein